LSSISQEVALHLNEEYCSSCSICASLCPFEAIKKDPQTGKTTLEIEKCQVCGICYSACPAQALSIGYYDADSLFRYLERARKEYDSDRLLIMCKGVAPDFKLAGELLGISKFIPLSVPCVGRLPEDLFLRTLTKLEVKKIYLLVCEEDFCRFEKGSRITGRKIRALNLLLEQFGYGEEVISLKRYTPKVKADRDKCIKCGNCVFYCPYESAKLVGSEAAKFNLDSCRGCGLCIALCPAMALELENWEGEFISASISRLASQIKEPKILIFRCQWAAFPPLDGEFSENVGIIDLPCAGRVDTLHILEALGKGIKGILIAACPEDECKLKRGSKEARRSVEALKERLGQIGLGERLHFCSVAPRYPQSFNQELERFKVEIERSQG